MSLILTNDDGIDAPGIRSLEKACRQTALLKTIHNSKVIIVAPKDHLSGCGHQVTTTQPIHVQRRADTEYAIAGTPADCVRLAYTHIAPDVKYVISGINAGGNMGADTYISGTVAAVREAAFHRIPGIAVSHYRKGKRNVDWDVAARWTAGILTDLFKRPVEPGTFWNVNLPHLEPGAPDPDVVFCEPSTQPLPVNYRIEGDNFYYVGDYAKRDRTPGSDVDICFSGKIAVTQLRL